MKGWDRGAQIIPTPPGETLIQVLPATKTHSKLQLCHWNPHGKRGTVVRNMGTTSVSWVHGHSWLSPLASAPVGRPYVSFNHSNVCLAKFYQELGNLSIWFHHHHHFRDTHILCYFVGVWVCPVQKAYTFFFGRVSQGVGGEKESDISLLRLHLPDLKTSCYRDADSLSSESVPSIRRFSLSDPMGR